MNAQNYGQMYVPMTPTVKWLLILTTAVWVVLQLIGESMLGLPVAQWFALHPDHVIFNFSVWQLFTYIFLHTTGVTHILLNLLTLWFIGAELEQRWGRKFFLIYYLSSGIGAALFYCLGVGLHFMITGKTSGLLIPVMGASGAVFGLLLAYGILFGERTLHFMMLFPMKAKVFVIILAGVEIVSLLGAGVAGSEVANLAHLGGFASGYLTLLIYTRIQRVQWQNKSKKKSRNLRLVVDNDSSSKSQEGPKYWN